MFVKVKKQYKAINLTSSPQREALIDREILKLKKELHSCVMESVQILNSCKHTDDNDKLAQIRNLLST